MLLPLLMNLGMFGEDVVEPPVVNPEPPPPPEQSGVGGKGKKPRAIKIRLSDFGERETASKFLREQIRLKYPVIEDKSAFDLIRERDQKRLEKLRIKREARMREEAEKQLVLEEENRKRMINNQILLLMINDS